MSLWLHVLRLGFGNNVQIRKFDLDRVFAEIEWCAKSKVRSICADANFGIFARDVDIAHR